MPARRFIGYFIVLATCSTVAFASSLIGHPPLPPAQDTESSVVPMIPSMSHLRWHKAPLRPAQIAQAE